MILSFLSTRAGKFAAAGVALILAVIAFTLWLRNERQEAVERDRAEAAQVIAKSQERAEAAAQATGAAIQQEVDRTNADARKAAAGSDDVLKSGFDSLRRGKASGGASAPQSD